MVWKERFVVAIPNTSTSMLLVYVWWLVATPYHRFEIFGIIHFERILALAIGLLLFFLNREGKRSNSATIYLSLLFVTLAASFLLSPYSDILLAQVWAKDYWKVFVLYFLIVYGITDRSQLVAWIVGIALICALYQLHTWIDFLQGGSYVYQQGLKRIAGVWSGGGLGAANSFASMSLYTIPYAMFWYEASKARLERYAAVAIVFVCCASILFSGVRAGVVVAIFYFGVHFRRQIFRPASIVIALISIAVLVRVLPSEYTERYMTILRTTPQAEVYTERHAKDVETAQASALARIAGLKDGWELLKRRPLLGYGPGSSSMARLEVNPTMMRNDGGAPQLHNLYGQIMSESGLVGSSLFVALIFSIFLSSRKVLDNVESDLVIRGVFRLIVGLAIMMLAYGMFSHSLYQPRWVILFATFTVAMSVLRDKADLQDEG